MREHIDKVIPCVCFDGGLRVRGIEADHEEGNHYLYMFNLHSPGYGNLSLWQRIKYAWSFIFGRNAYVDDVVLDEAGVTALKDACQEALDRWPDAHLYLDLDHGYGLDKIMQECEDERRGRELRLKESELNR